MNFSLDGQRAERQSRTGGRGWVCPPGKVCGIGMRREVVELGKEPGAMHSDTDATMRPLGVIRKFAAAFADSLSVYGSMLAGYQMERSGRLDGPLAVLANRTPDSDSFFRYVLICSADSSGRIARELT